MDKSLQVTLIRICTGGGDQLFHSCYDGVVARKMFPAWSIFHQFEQMEIRRHQIWTIWWVWYDSPAKTENMLHSLQIGIGPGFVMLKEKICLLWPVKIWAFSLISIVMELSELVVCLGCGKSRRITSFLYPLKTVLNFFSSVEYLFGAIPWTVTSCYM